MQISDSDPWSDLNPNQILSELLKLKPGFKHFDHLEALLTHENPRIVASAVETIERLAPRESISKTLLPIINHENNRVRANVITAIGKFDEPKIQIPLSEMLQSPKISMRESAVWAVGQLKPSSFLKSALLKRLHDPYRDIRLRAIEALANYPELDVITQMRRLSNDLDPEIRDKANKIMQDLTHSLDKVSPRLIIQEETQDSGPVDEDDYDEFIDEEPGYLQLESGEKESISIEADYLDSEDEPPEELEKTASSKAEPPIPTSTDDFQKAVRIEPEGMTPFEQFERFSNGSPTPQAKKIENRLQNLSDKASLQKRIENWDPRETLKQPAKTKPPKVEETRVEEPVQKPSKVVENKEDPPKLKGEDKPEKKASRSFIKPAPTQRTKVEDSSQYSQPDGLPSVQPKPRPAPEPTREEKIQQQIQLLLRNVGQEAYNLCQEYSPGNRALERANDLVLRAQARLQRFQNTDPTTPEELFRMRELQTKLRETFVVLGKTAMKEVNRTDFTLHGIEEYQKRLRKLLDRLAESKT
jgi:hypothetical protein